MSSKNLKIRVNMYHSIFKNEHRMMGFSEDQNDLYVFALS